MCPQNWPLTQALERELQHLEEQNLLRTLTTVEAIDGVTVRVQGRDVVSWCTNDYLGLSVHPQVIEAAGAAARRWGVGARASRLLAGTTALHTQLEERLAEFFHADAALVYPSGYLANLGTLSTLLGPNDVVVIDRLAHASLVDACRLSRARLRVFSHNDPDHLAAVLARETTARPPPGAGRRRVVVVTEGLFSMNGDYAPLEALREVTRRSEALLYVDDAHGAFASGATGRGTPELQGVAHGDFLYIGTLGKALGCQGGFVVGARAFITLLHNRARPFLYSTALACPVVGAALAALQLVQEDPAPRARLAALVARWRARYPAGAVQSYIVPVLLGSASRAVEAAQRLWQRGHFAPAIRPPTVPRGTARLRVSLSALHTDSHLDRLCEALEDVGVTP